ncbi:hypothetical protein B296_00013144 [Ensete ventricosum]|uniref:Vps16 C-terminal domain-containing protein n=1 Tax=Ensete ventricosum TaxID=4639 RepID=A0A427AQM1_ENSVE|nr:hypothetical protein B296_00013144 [Ensete ventricosum]
MLVLFEHYCFRGLLSLLDTSDTVLLVPLLLSIEEEDSALVKAIESGDTDLVYLVLFHIWQKVSLLLILKLHLVCVNYLVCGSIPVM